MPASLIKFFFAALLLQGVFARLAFAEALLTISDPLTYDFGTVVVGNTASKTFTVTNSGGSNATSVAGAALAAPFSYTGGTYPGTGGTCGNSIPRNGGTCTVSVTY